MWSQKNVVENGGTVSPLSCEEVPWVDDSLLGSSHLESAKNNHG